MTTKDWATLHKILFVNPTIRDKMADTYNIVPLSADILVDRIASSRRIVIISAYYDVPFLLSLFDHKKILNDKQICMIFAHPAPSALGKQVRELTEFENQLHKKGNAGTTVDVALAEGGRLLHTKLYNFQNGKWLRTLIGSANATTNGFSHNDEILLEIRGRNTALDRYIKHTRNASVNCKDVNLSANEQFTSFQSLLRDGFIYFKPTRSVPYTLDCFENKRAVVSRLEKVVSGNPLPFHEGQSVGMLNILRLLGVDIGKPHGIQDRLERVKITPFAIETAFGYWVPSAYETRLQDRVERLTVRKANLLRERGRQLSARTDSDVVDIIRSKYFDDIDSRLSSISSPRLTTTDKQDIENRVLRRVKRVQQLLSSEEECRRVARSLDGTPVPEIWEDPHSRTEMMDSFCEYVSWKLGSPTRIPGIVQKLREWFNLKNGDEPKDIREKIERYFKIGKILRRNDWASHSFDEDHSDEEEDE